LLLTIFGTVVKTALILRHLRLKLYWAEYVAQIREVEESCLELGGETSQKLPYGTPF
jgi:hypothetical protein